MKTLSTWVLAVTITVGVSVATADEYSWTGGDPGFEHSWVRWQNWS